MRIVHVVGSSAPRYGGPDVAARLMCRALRARGHEVDVLTTDLDGRGRLDVPLGTPVEEEGVRITYHRVRRPRSYVFSPDLARSVARLAPEADVVHVHSLYLFHGLVAGAVCRRSGVPYVVRPHGTLDRYHRNHRRARKAVYDRLVERRNLDRAAAIHCTSETERREVANAGVRAPLVVVPLAVDTHELGGPGDPARLLSEWPELAGKSLVTFVGRLTSKKRLDVLLDAFATIASERRDAHLVVAGPGENGAAEALRRRAEALGIASRTSVPGIVTGARKAALLGASQAFVLVSEDENFGLAVAEAMAAGVPVVVSDRVALSASIAEARAGVVTPVDPAAVAAAIGEVLSDPAGAEAMGLRGQALAEERFGLERLGAELEQLYVHIAEGGGRWQ